MAQATVTPRRMIRAVTAIAAASTTGSVSAAGSAAETTTTATATMTAGGTSATAAETWVYESAWRDVRLGIDEAQFVTQCPLHAAGAESLLAVAEAGAAAVAAAGTAAAAAGGDVAGGVAAAPPAAAAAAAGCCWGPKGCGTASKAGSGQHGAGASGRACRRRGGKWAHLL